MNYYFLLEDEKSFIKVLPKWLEHMGFECTRVADITEVTSNSYVMQSGQGVTQLITKVLYQTLDTILNSSAVIDTLVVIVDAEELEVETRRQEIYDKIVEYQQKNPSVEIDFEIKVTVCNHCFESWLLGNEDIYPEKKPDKDSAFYPYYMHYNIKMNDPEHMSVPEGVGGTIARYHFHYLHDAFLYNKIRYNKKKPDYVANEDYFLQLVSRMNKTVHIRSFKELWEYIQLQKLRMKENEGISERG